MGNNMGGVTAVPRTFGILSIVFASIVILFSLFGLVGLIVPVLLKHAPTTRPEDAQAMAMLSSMYTCMGQASRTPCSRASPKTCPYTAATG